MLICCSTNICIIINVEKSCNFFQRTHQSAESLRRIPAGDAWRLDTDAHVLLHGLGFGLARVMLPHGAFVCAHERLALVVLASCSRQHMHQQVEKSCASTHGRRVNKRGFPRVWRNGTGTTVGSKVGRVNMEQQRRRSG